jgi:hypothetical protein
MDKLPKRYGAQKRWVSFGPLLTGQNISLIQQNKNHKKYLTKPLKKNLTKQPYVVFVVYAAAAANYKTVHFKKKKKEEAYTERPERCLQRPIGSPDADD